MTMILTGLRVTGLGRRVGALRADRWRVSRRGLLALGRHRFRAFMPRRWPGASVVVWRFHDAVFPARCRRRCPIAMRRVDRGAIVVARRRDGFMHSRCRDHAAVLRRGLGHRMGSLETPRMLGRENRGMPPVRLETLRRIAQGLVVLLHLELRRRHAVLIGV